jgi:hypothetical protein
VLAMMFVHEWFHGLAIIYFGHKVRYGMKLSKGVLYATAGGALFWRNQYIAIALSPLVGISLLVFVGMLFAPEPLAIWIAMIGTLNAVGAIGDLWMTFFLLRYATDVIVRDEEDGMRIFVRQTTA